MPGRLVQDLPLSRLATASTVLPVLGFVGEVGFYARDGDNHRLVPVALPRRGFCTCSVVLASLNDKIYPTGDKV